MPCRKHWRSCLLLAASTLPLALTAQTLRQNAALSHILVAQRDATIKSAADKTDEQAIRSMLDRQTADWNRGDLDAFAVGYKHSPDILFMGGNTIRRGYDGMLQRYKESYPNRERMGRLTFSQLEIQPMSAQFATSTGHFHLERTAAGGGNADGFFLLVLEKTSDGWKIVRDDTTPLSAAKAH